jgi:hypothetical protein
VHAARKRRLTCGGSPAPPLLDPPGNRLRISTRQAAQPRDGLGLDRILGTFALSRAEPDPGNLGQQIAAASGQFAQFRRSRGCLRIVQGAPPGEPPGSAVKPCDEDPVSLRTVIDHAFEYSRLGDFSTGEATEPPHRGQAAAGLRHLTASCSL